MTARTAEVSRITRETRIHAEVNLDGIGEVKTETGLGFLDHMVSALGRHGRFDVRLTCEGDLDVDDHHTVEDCAIVLGECVDRALGERNGIERFGDAVVPMDEALARVAVDLSGRSVACVELGFAGERLGAVRCENLTHFFVSFARSLRAAVHVDVLRGENDHHRAEAAFKGLAVALRRAVALSGSEGVPSTKGVL